MKLSQRIRLRSNADGSVSASGPLLSGEDTELFFHKTFPFFIWLLRDVTQSIPKKKEVGKERERRLLAMFSVFLGLLCFYFRRLNT